MEHAQLAMFVETMMKSLMMETNIWMAATNYMENYVRNKIMLAQDSFKREIGYVSAKLDTKRTDIKIMKDCNQIKFNSMGTTII